MKAEKGVLRAIWALAFGLVLVGRVFAEVVVVQPADNGYNAWPMVQAIGEKIVCAYSRGTAHDISQGVRGVYARASSDGGATWGDEVTVANDGSYGEVAIGKGLDADGAMLLWVRCWGGANPHHDLYRTVDGATFTKVATPTLNPVPMQITDVITVPGVGMMCLWFSDGYSAGSVRSWGKLVSADNGSTWTQTTIETGLDTDDWPTEPSGVWLGDGKILVIARCEGANRQFQITSTDSGATWTKRTTNITDVRTSTPALIYDATTGLISNYYYERGAKKLKLRVVAAADIFAHPDRWPAPTVLYVGEETVEYDAGNVNVTVKAGGSHLATTYTGTSSNTKIVALAVAAPTAAPTAAETLPTATLLSPAKCYSQRGLILHLDGLENVGAGAPHDSSVRLWKDLSSSENDAFLTEMGSFGDDGLEMKITGAVKYAAYTSKALTSGMTAEGMIRLTGGDADQTTSVWGGAGSDGGHIPMPRVRVQTGPTRNFMWMGFDGGGVGSWCNNVVADTAYQFAVRSWDQKTWSAYTNGVKTGVSFSPSAQNIASEPLSLGGFTGFDRRMEGTIHTVRVYDRTLSETELLVNALFDRVRYDGVDPSTIDWPKGFRYSAADGLLRVRVRVTAQDDRLVAVDGGTPVRTFDEMVCRGKQLTVVEWSAVNGVAESVVGNHTVFADEPVVLSLPVNSCAIPASVYSGENLVLHYDGFENVGAGQPFDATSRVWKDLSSSANDGDLTAMGTFADGGLSMHDESGVDYAVLTRNHLQSVKTMECVVCVFGSDEDEPPAALWGGYSDGGTLPLPRLRVTTSNSYLGSPAYLLSASEGSDFCPLVPEVVQQQLALVNESANTYVAYVDGVTTGKSVTHTSTASRMSFGGFNGFLRRVFGVLSEIRAYDRVLSPTELRKHALLDKARFCPHRGYGYRWDETNGKLQVELEFACQGDGAMTVDGVKVDKSGSVWVDYGADVEFAVRGRGGEFVSWSGYTGGISDQDLSSPTIVLHGVDEPRKLVANFTERKPGLTVIVY